MLIVLIAFLIIAIFGYIALDRRDSNIRDRLDKSRSKRHVDRQELMDQMKAEYEERHRQEKEKMEHQRKKPFLFVRIHKALRADDFLHGNFHQIFISNSLKGREAELDKLRNIYAKNTSRQQTKCRARL